MVQKAWQSRRLRFMFDTKSGATPFSSESAFWGGDIWWVTPEDLGKLEGSLVTSTKRTLTEEGYLSCGTS